MGHGGVFIFFQNLFFTISLWLLSFVVLKGEAVELAFAQFGTSDTPGESYFSICPEALELGVFLFFLPCNKSKLVLMSPSEPREISFDKCY